MRSVTLDIKKNQALRAPRRAWLLCTSARWTVSTTCMKVSPLHLPVLKSNFLGISLRQHVLLHRVYSQWVFRVLCRPCKAYQVASIHTATQGRFFFDAQASTFHLSLNRWDLYQMLYSAQNTILQPLVFRSSTIFTKTSNSLLTSFHCLLEWYNFRAGCNFNLWKCHSVC